MEWCLVTFRLWRCLDNRQSRIWNEYDDKDTTDQQNHAPKKISEGTWKSLEDPEESLKVPEQSSNHFCTLQAKPWHTVTFESESLVLTFSYFQNRLGDQSTFICCTLKPNISFSFLDFSGVNDNWKYAFVSAKHVCSESRVKCICSTENLNENECKWHKWTTSWWKLGRCGSRVGFAANTALENTLGENTLLENTPLENTLYQIKYTFWIYTVIPILPSRSTYVHPFHPPSYIFIHSHPCSSISSIVIHFHSLASENLKLSLTDRLTIGQTHRGQSQICYRI